MPRHFLNRFLTRLTHTFSTGVCECSVKGYWAPRDATRSFAILIMTLGSTWSTMVAAWLTPPLAGWAGWRAVPCKCSSRSDTTFSKV